MSSELNTSGREPVDTLVLIAPVEVARVTTGGVHLPEKAADREQQGIQEGRIVAIGPRAFYELRALVDGAEYPMPGDEVSFRRYQHVEWKGKDGKPYWFIKDEDVLGMTRAPAAAEARNAA